MLRVGLTGSIGTGKSTVARFIEELGLPVIDADRIVHELLSAGTGTNGRVREAFGEEVVLPDGSIDRRKLGEIVFANGEKRHLLNSIVHPAVRGKVSSRIAEIEQEGRHSVVVVEAALMVETGYHLKFDLLIVVVCDPELQLRRVMERSGLSVGQARERMVSQLPSEAKVRVADFVVDNGGTMEDTRSQVARIVQSLLSHPTSP